jgi:hypothetical protein
VEDSKNFVLFTIKGINEKSNEEEFVYPLSMKYDTKTKRKMMIDRYIWFGILVLLFVLFIIFSLKPFRRAPIRLGYFADKITIKTVFIDGASEIDIQTKDWVVYLLENTDSKNEIELYVSASRVTDINTPREGGVQKIEVLSEINTVLWYAEIRIPGGVTIPKISFKFQGDRIDNLMLYDFKDDSNWVTPLIVTELQFKISDAYPNILMKNSHQVSTLTVSGSYCVCNFHTLKIGSMNFDVTLGSLSIIQNSGVNVNKMIVKTPHGTHWIAAETINTVDTDCPSEATRNSGISGTFIDTSKYCTSELYVCSNSATSCPSSGTAASTGQGSFTIILNDGPVQFLIDGSTTTATSTYTPTFDTFSITSQLKLEENKEDFSTEPNDSRIYLYKVVSPGYAKMWTHSSLKQYIQARPWLISLLSMNLLKPTYFKNTLIHIPGGACPYAGPNAVKTNTLISEKIKSLSFTESSHLISVKEPDTYYEFILTAENEYLRQEINFFDGNILIWLLFVFTLIIALTAVVLIFYLITKFILSVEDNYKKELDYARKFSRSKKDNQGKGFWKDADFDKITQKKPENKHNYYLKMGVFGCKIDSLQEKGSKIVSNFSKSIQNRRESNLSFYKIIFLTIDYCRRKWRNSLREFIDSIAVDSNQFSKYSSDLESDKEHISILLEELKAKYHEFWTKYGLRYVPIESKPDILKEFNLALEERSSLTTNWFINIRWKTLFEKNKPQNLQSTTDQFDEKDEDGDCPQKSVVESFLQSEWKSSIFRNDYILATDLKQKYTEYCIKHEIDKIYQSNIIESPELDRFGAKLREKQTISFVLGIAKKEIDRENKGYPTSKLVRNPFDLDGTKRKFSWWKRFLFFLNKWIFTKHGFLSNALYVLIYLIIMLSIPLFIYVVFIWSLIQVNVIRSDIYAPVFTFRDVFHSSGYDVWINDLEEVWLFYSSGALWTIYIIFGFTELFWFFNTALEDTGKYTVIKTWPRWTISMAFWIMLTFFSGLYAAYLTIICIWAVLGAILNPENFLPIATAAVVIVVAIVFLYTKLNLVYNTLKDIVYKKLDSQMKLTLIDKIQKESSSITSLLESFETIPKRDFFKKLDSFMKKNKFPPVTKDQVSSIIGGNIEMIANIMHKNWGIDYKIAWGLVGLLANDPIIILNSIYKISNELKFDTQSNIYLAELALSSIGNESFENENISKSAIIMIMKQFLQSKNPEFPCSILDDIFEIVLHHNPRSLLPVWAKLGIKRELFDLICAYLENNDALIQEWVADLFKKIAPEHESLFIPFYLLVKGDFENQIKTLTKIFGVKHSFLFRIILGILKQDWNYSQRVIEKSIEEVFQKITKLKANHERNLPNKISLEKQGEVITDALLSFYCVSHDRNLDLVGLVKGPLPNIPSEKVSLIQKATEGDSNSIRIISENMRWKNPTLISQYGDLLTKEEFSIDEILKRLKIDPEDSLSLIAILKIIINAAKYSKHIRENWYENGHISSPAQNKEKRASVKEEIKKNLAILKWIKEDTELTSKKPIENMKMRQNFSKVHNYSVWKESMNEMEGNYWMNWLSD